MEKKLYEIYISSEDECSHTIRKEIVTKGVTRLFENGIHKATILNCEDLSAYNAKQ